MMKKKMRIAPPVDPLFRAGEMGLGYDAESKLIVILVREIVTEGGDPDEASVVRFWCNPTQARWLATWGTEVVNRGRPDLPAVRATNGTRRSFLAPRKNGHKH